LKVIIFIIVSFKGSVWLLIVQVGVLYFCNISCCEMKTVKSLAEKLIFKVWFHKLRSATPQEILRRSPN
jgi:hypothetical protein